MSTASTSAAPPQQLGKDAVAPQTPVIMTADMYTPPSSPAGLHNGGFKPFHFRQNAFAQWGGAPLSPTLTARSDEESEVGFSDDGASSRSPSPPRYELPTTPKGHPLENSKSLLWGHHFTNHVRGASRDAAAAVGLGLGLEKGDRFDLSEDAFESRERERRVCNLSSGRPSVALEQPKMWPKIRIPRRTRPALYLVGCIFSLLLYVLSHRPATSTSASLARSAAQLDFRNAPRGGSTSTAILNRRAKAARAEELVLAQPTGAAVEADKWIWASRDEELAALLSYIISAEANHIPAIDASVPLDPSLLLDFDPYSRQANSHLTELQHNLWNDYPVVVLAKQRNAHTRFIRSELDKLYLSPKPMYIDTDARSDTDILVGLLDRLIDRSDLPLVLVGGKVVGGWVEMNQLVKADALKSLLLDAGAASVPPKKKKSKKAGHGGKTEEQLNAAIEAEKAKDEERRKRAEEEVELYRLKQLSIETPEEIPVEDANDQEFY